MKGFFKPTNKAKYRGDTSNIVYRSSLEFKYMCWLDDNPSVLQWSSEEIIIPYKDRTSGRIRRYYPDFWYRTSSKQYLIEIKPARQCVAPKPSKNKKTYVTEVRTYGTNISKWEAAEKFSKTQNMTFIILTEKDIEKLPIFLINKK